MHPMKKIFIVLWRYSDNSGNGIVAAFEAYSNAQDLMDILQEHAEGRVFHIAEVEIRP